MCVPAGLAPNAPLPPCSVHALTYAHLIDRAVAAISPASSSSSSSSSGRATGGLGRESTSAAEGSISSGLHAEMLMESSSSIRPEDSSRPSISPEDEERVRQLQQQQQRLQPLINLAQYQLQLAAKAAKPDQLTPTARCVSLCCAHGLVCPCPHPWPGASLPTPMAWCVLAHTHGLVRPCRPPGESLRRGFSGQEQGGVWKRCVHVVRKGLCFLLEIVLLQPFCTPLWVRDWH